MKVDIIIPQVDHFVFPVAAGALDWEELLPIELLECGRTPA